MGNRVSFFFILSGTAKLELNGEIISIHTHEGIEVPSGVPHQMFNQTDKDIEFIVVSCPASHGDRITL
jgi:mannose-6-phosphate isomerase-like protein (cupin superfamily)